MNIRFVSKISGLVAVFALLFFSIAPVTQAAGISIDDQRCVDGDGVVEVTFPSNIESFKLSGPDEDEQNTTANFKTFSDLSDGNYTLTAYTESGGATATFEVNCDDVTPDPEDPTVSIDDKRCVVGGGVVEASFTNITRFKLSGPNTDEQNSTANFKTFSDLADGSYTLEAWNSADESSQTSFSINCDPTGGNKATLKVFSEGTSNVPINHLREDVLGSDGTTNYTRTYNQAIPEGTWWLTAPTNRDGKTVSGWEGCDRVADNGRSCAIESGIDLGETRSVTVIYEKKPETCDPNPEADLKAIAFNANNGTVTIKNSSNNCSYKVGIASYKGFNKHPDNDNWVKISNQELFDSQTSQVQAGKSVTLDIDVPSCAYQIDAFYGNIIESFAGGDRYGERLLAYDHINVHNLCGEDKEDGPQIQLEAKACVADEGQGGSGFGSASFKTSTGLDSYKLINTSTGNTVVNDTNGAGKGSISFSDLPNGNYRLEGKLNGKTKSATFTIDCESGGPILSGSCSVSDSSVGLSDNVTFTANVSGGQSPYSYSWNLEGSDDDANTKSITTEYKQTGTYDATVIIRDNAGDEIMRTCSVTVNRDDDDDDDDGGGGDRLDPRDKDVRGDRDINFGVQCLPEKSIYGVGEVVLFEATIDNDDVDIDDIDFDWSGAENIRETDETATVQFRTNGVKEIRVRAEYDGDTETDTCYVQIGRGVSLDKVPYTGPSDAAKALGFITTILLLALGGGYAIIRRREGDGIPVGIPNKYSN